MSDNVKNNTYKASVTFGYSVLVDASDEYTAQSKAAEMFDYWVQNQKFPKLNPEFVRIVRVFDDDIEASSSGEDTGL